MVECKCKGCGLPCTWARKGKKWHLMEPNGQSHRCAIYRQKKPKREPAEKIGPRITGKNYRPNCGDCRALPWQDCACSRAAAAVNAEADAAFQRLLDLAETA